jgi:ribosomal protein L23
MSVKSEHYDVIRKPIITEKATMASEAGAVVFEVAVESNKPQIKEAVEKVTQSTFPQVFDVSKLFNGFFISLFRILK